MFLAYNQGTTHKIIALSPSFFLETEVGFYNTSEIGLTGAKVLENKGPELYLFFEFPTTPSTMSGTR